MYTSYHIFNKEKINCRKCIIGKCYDKVVPSDGNLIDPLIMVIGEAPGKTEIEHGKPFIGKSGSLLRETLSANGFNSINTVITNTIPCRPQDNKFPKNTILIKQCMQQWLEIEIQILKPTFIILVGGVALKYVLGMTNITSVHGKWLTSNNYLDVRFMAIFHPSYVLRKQHMTDGQNIMKAFQSDIAKVAQQAFKSVP